MDAIVFFEAFLIFLGAFVFFSLIFLSGLAAILKLNRKVDITERMVKWEKYRKRGRLKHMLLWIFFLGLLPPVSFLLIELFTDQDLTISRFIIFPMVSITVGHVIWSTSERNYKKWKSKMEKEYEENPLRKPLSAFTSRR